jgi:hypothetical protein
VRGFGFVLVCFRSGQTRRSAPLSANKKYEYKRYQAGERSLDGLLVKRAVEGGEDHGAMLCRSKRNCQEFFPKTLKLSVETS